MGKNIYFSTYPPPTLIHLSHRFTSASKPTTQKSLTVVLATSAPPFQPLRHQRNVCHPVVNSFTRHTLPTVNRKHFFMNILCIEFFRPQKKRTTERCSSVVYTQARSIFSLLKPASELAHVRLLPRLSWSWTVLLPSDTLRKPITSITAVLLPFVTYLLTLPHS
jgi:hypothetical protein